jgi:hypothetical protein
MIAKPDTAARLTFVAIQTSIVFCAIIFDVANPPFSRVSEGRFQRGFLYGLANVGYYNSNASIGRHAIIKHGAAPSLASNH